MTQLFPVALYELGYRDLVSVIPPNATLAPSSKISAGSLGKVPGRKNANGTWGGYDWRRHEPTVDDVRRWATDGANIGIRAGRFPGLDIDSLDPVVAEQVERIAHTVLGPAPVRTGKAPKRLLMYRLTLDQTFARMRLLLTKDGVTHLIELLADGQQYLVYGTHPSTKRPYEWSEDLTRLPADRLIGIYRDDVERLFEKLAEHFTGLGFVVQREGDGRRKERAAANDQTSLHAPSLDDLRAAVACIPNTDALFPTRDDYIKMGYAIRAACGDEIEDGYMVFAEWAGRHVADGRVAGNPETWRSDWRRMKGPFEVGWPWIAELARSHGYNDAANDFDAEGDAPTSPPRSRVKFSDQWLATQVVRRTRERLRFVPATGRWLVWNGRSWELDELLQARAVVGAVLHDIACDTLAAATSDKAIAEATRVALRIESEHTLAAVMRLVRADASIATSTAALDADPWVLNTPAGLVDLRTGKVSPTTPDALCTKLTRTGPDLGGACPEWRRFLAEATGGNRELEEYLQRLAGYALTGDTSEQTFTFVWGPGGNGKSVFLNAVRDVMGDYAKVAAMDTFVASKFDKHTTDLADLMGARLVTASETAGGYRWDESRVKTLTGAEPIKARFMRQDNFTFTPYFKLIFAGNHKPALRDLDDAMRRRVHLVPFTVTPAQVDKQLAAKLEAEYPAILGWMIEGCLAWRRRGLAAPEIVREATQEYFTDEDALGRWLAENCDRDPNALTYTTELYENWREWANAAGEYVVPQRRFVQALVQRRFERWQHPETRRNGFRGLQLKAQVNFP